MAAQEGKAAVVRLLTEAQAQLNIQKNVCVFSILSTMHGHQFLAAV